jgi:hypothetical protein
MVVSFIAWNGSSEQVMSCDVPESLTDEEQVEEYLEGIGYREVAFAVSCSPDQYSSRLAAQYGYEVIQKYVLDKVMPYGQTCPQD